MKSVRTDFQLKHSPAAKKCHKQQYSIIPTLFSCFLVFHYAYVPLHFLMFSNLVSYAS